MRHKLKQSGFIRLASTWSEWKDGQKSGENNRLCQLPKFLSGDRFVLAVVGGPLSMTE
jgi:hypothetical protein